MKMLALLSLSLFVPGPAAFGQTALRPGSQFAPWGNGANTSTPTLSSLQEAKVTVYPDAIRKPGSNSRGGTGGGGLQSLADLFNQALTTRPAAGGGLFSPSLSGSEDISNMDMRDCEGKKPDPQALDTMVNCANMKLSMASNAKAALVDVDQKVMFIVNRGTRQVEGCVNISTGKSTGAGKGQTPLGMMITGSHDGGKYQSDADGTRSDCIGLRGTDPETIARANNGVVIHKAHGRAGLPATAGCIGVQDDKFDSIKDILYGSDRNPKASAIYIHNKFSHHNCNGSRNAPTPELQQPGASETGS